MDQSNVVYLVIAPWSMKSNIINKVLPKLHNLLFFHVHISNDDFCIVIVNKDTVAFYLFHYELY